MLHKEVHYIPDKPSIEMRPIYNVYLKDPNNRTEDETQSINTIGKKINQRLGEISELHNEDCELHIAIFYGKEIPDSFQDLGNRIYFKDATSLKNFGWAAFLPTVKAGLSKLTVPTSINSIAIVFSLTKLSEEDVFALNGDRESPRVNYQAQNPESTLNDVVMNEDEKNSLLRALTIITERDLIFNKWGFNKVDRSTKSVLCFHGAAGTGKTMCAHAVADYLGKKIIIGSYSKIQSKFVGEGEKNLVAYFKAAEEQDAVLFIDEADTFLSKRLPSSNENSKHYNSMSNELYQLIEKFNGCIVFASNHIKDFDPAVISRIIEPIEFKLPDKATRIKIMKKLLPPTAPIELSDDEFSKLAILTDGFSGRDIRKAMLIFVAQSAYNHRVLKHENVDEIKLSFSEIEAAFKSVKRAKDNLNQNVSGFSIAGRVSEESKKNTRLLQIAAHTLWIDGVLAEQEKNLFNELCSQLGTSIDITDKDSLPSVETICSVVINKQEKVQMLDIACRMAAIDGEYPDKEKIFVANLATILGFSKDAVDNLDDYILKLISENKQWSEIAAHVHNSEYDIIKELAKEYSEASSWNKLGMLYITGGELAGVSISPNVVRARICLNKAREMGYTLSEEGEKFISNE